MGLVGVESAHGSLETAFSPETTTIVPPKAPASIPHTRTYFEIELLLARHEHAYQAFDCNTQGEHYTLDVVFKGGSGGPKFWVLHLQAVLGGVATQISIEAGWGRDRSPWSLHMMNI